MPGNYREELEQITEAHAADLKVQTEKLVSCSILHGLNLKLRHDGERMGPVNCHRYALGLGELPYWLEALLEREKRQMCDGDFILSLIEIGVLTSSDVRDGGVVVYKNRGRLTHSGRVFERDVVSSKWGGGHVWLHRPLNVPASYGDQLTYYFHSQPEQVQEELERYCIRTLGEEVIDDARSSGLMPFGKGHIPKEAA